MKYISLDIETTGLDPEKCQTLEIGAIFEDTNNPTSYEEAKKFRAIIPHDFIQGSPFAIDLNKDLIKTIKTFVSFPGVFEADDYARNNNIVQGNRLAAEFKDWIINECGLDMNKGIVVAGKNFEAFDKKFLVKFPDWNRLVKFHRRTIDPAILCVDWLNDETIPSLTECLKRCRIDKDVAHTSLEDAWDVIQVLREHYKVTKTQI